MQAIWAAITTADDSGQAESADSSPAEGAKPQVAVITASGVLIHSLAKAPIGLLHL